VAHEKNSRHRWAVLSAVCLLETKPNRPKDILIVDQKAENSDKWNNIKNHSFSDYLESDDFLKRLERRELRDISAIFHMGACSSTTEMNKAYLRGK